MFDSVGVFTKQFTPVEGGYLYYPSSMSGGKLITAAEYEDLEANWRRVAGKKGQWKLVSIALLAIVAWILLSEALAPPGWADAVFMAGLVASITGWYFWASFAPRRLVKNRSAVSSPKPRPQARREARALLNWRLVIFVLLFSGAIFVSILTSADRSAASWAWLIGSGLMFLGYAWIAVLKITDGRR